MLADLYGKYPLERRLAAPVQEAVFEYLDLLGLLWEKTFSENIVTMLEQRILIVLTKLQLLLQAWELNMNRRMMLHLVQAFRCKPSEPMAHAAGPCLV